MICKSCGRTNAEVNKCCHFCGAILEGETINNVTGEFGYRNADGSFTTFRDAHALIDDDDKETLESYFKRIVFSCAKISHFANLGATHTKDIELIDTVKRHITRGMIYLRDDVMEMLKRW